MIYKVLVVDDSAFMRKIISDLITDDPSFQVVATAKNGKEAVESVKRLKPDVITMDVEMPIMNGLEAVRRIMEECPTPVVMLSSLTEAGAQETLQALEWGAVDFVRKPSGSISIDLYKVKQALSEKLNVAVRTKMIRNKAAMSHFLKFPAKKEEPSAKLSNLNQNHFNHIVAIGTSTGGPRALQQVISQLPAAFPAPLLVVQHMPPNFTKSLANRLDSISAIHVVEAENNMPVQSATAYIAPGGWHMIIVKEYAGSYRIRLNKDETRSGHRPSVNVLYESLLPLRELKRHVVLMTGMGNDGAQGMNALKSTGAHTIAESEKTCVVYGMPRAAIELNCVDYVLPLHDISAKLIDLVGI